MDTGTETTDNDRSLEDADHSILQKLEQVLANNEKLGGRLEDLNIRLDALLGFED